jgi:hypothetical protein
VLARRVAGRRVEQPGEPQGVNPVRGDTQRVAGAGRDDQLRAEQPAQPPDVAVQVRPGVDGTVEPPDGGGEPIRRHRMRRAHGERGEQRRQPGAGELDRPTVDHDAQRAEQPDLHDGDPRAFPPAFSRVAAPSGSLSHVPTDLPRSSR